MFSPRIANSLGVVPILIGPMQMLLSMLPAILLALGSLLVSIFSPRGAKRFVMLLWHQKIFTICAAGAIYMAFWGPIDWSTLLRHGGGAAKTGVDWPAFRGGAQRLGAAAGAIDPVMHNPVWDYKKYPTILSTPTVVGDRLYVSTVKLSIFDKSQGEGAIACLDARTGDELWRYTKNYRATFSSPAVEGDYLVCGEGLHWTHDARMVCLDLKHPGTRLWEYSTQYHVETSPCIYKGRAYFGAGHDGYYCLDLKPGPDGKAHVVWHLGGMGNTEFRGCESCPLVVDGVLYVGLGNEGEAILAVDADTGKVLWRIPTNYPVFAPPTVADGKLYIGMGNGDFINDAEAVRDEKIKRMRAAGKSEADIAAKAKLLGPIGEVWCIDLKTHEVEWKFKTDRTILGCLAYRDGKIYFGSRDGTFYCLSCKTHQALHKFNAHEPILSSCAVGSDHVYFVTKNGRLFCLNREDLSPLWDIILGAGDTFASSPTLALDHLYIGTQNDGLRCIGQAGKLTPIWHDGERGGVAQRGAWPARGVLDWRYPADDAADFQVSAPLMGLDGFVYAPVVRAEGGALLKLKPKLENKKSDRLVWTASFARPLTMAPAGAGELIYCVDGRPADQARTLHALKTADAVEAWHVDLASGACGRFTLDQRHLLIWSGPRTLACLDRVTGKEQWHADLGSPIGAPALASGMVVVATDAGLAALDDEHGGMLWQTPLKDAGFGPLCSGDAAVIATAAGIEVRSLEDGQVRWSDAIGPCAASPVADDQRVAVTTAAGAFTAYNLATGAKLAVLPDVDGSMSPLLPASELAMVRTAQNDFVCVETDQSHQPAQTTRFFRSSDLTNYGQVVSPVVVLDQNVIFATAKGVLCLQPPKR